MRTGTFPAGGPRRSAAVVLLLALLPAAAVLGSMSSASGTAATPGQLSFVAGTGVEGAPTPGPAMSSALGWADGVAFDRSGNLYIADAGEGFVEKVSPGGQLSLFAGNGSFGTPTPGPARSSALNAVDVAVDAAGNVYTADASANLVTKITQAGQLSIVAGTGTPGVPTPGPATMSALDYPKGVAVGSSGDVYISDTDNHVVERVTAGGILSIVGGTGLEQPPVPGPATQSGMDYPAGLALDRGGNLYVADRRNNTVEKITPGGLLTVLAGTGVNDVPTPGPATASALNRPRGVTVDSYGNVYIADTSGNRVERVSAAGELTILAGTGNGDVAVEGPAISSNLDYPYDVALDGVGNLYVADTDNHRVERITVAQPSGPIADKYVALGGSFSLLGLPVGPEFALPGGREQRYERGAIYWSARTGAHEVHGAIRDHWNALGGAAGPLGYPTTDETPGVGPTGSYNRFTGGTIYWSAPTGPHEVHGSNLRAYAALGAEHGPLGYPTTDELTTPDGTGRYNHFTGGSIYWTPATGSHQVKGAIQQHWASLGWETGALGYPLTDELTTPDGIGRYNHFTGGSIYWNPATGAHALTGSILTTWGALGWERSPLGYPTSDPYTIPGGQRCDFQHGTLTYTAATGRVTANGAHS